MPNEPSGVVAADTVSPAYVVSMARAELQRGKPWAARDRLNRLVAATPDPEALRLLGQVLFDMDDQPAAGAVWFASGERSPDAQAASDAWRAFHRDDFARLWASLPAGVREQSTAPRVLALKAKAGVQDDPADDASDSRDEPVASDPVPTDGATPAAVAVEPAESVESAAQARVEVPPEVPSAGSVFARFDATAFIAWLLAALVSVCAVVGFITIVGWLFG